MEVYKSVHLIIPMLIIFFVKLKRPSWLTLSIVLFVLIGFSKETYDWIAYHDPARIFISDMALNIIGVMIALTISHLVQLKPNKL